MLPREIFIQLPKFIYDAIVGQQGYWYLILMETVVSP